MPIETNLTGSPFFDDFDEDKNFHQILFKPGVAVQTRELNQLQTILQHQIEKFGDNVLTRGTIIEGCSFTYNTSYPYVKINDSQIDGLATVVNNYVGFYAASSSNLISQIVNGSAGYQSQDPNLNTLYLRYTNSGKSGTQTSYNANDIITVFDINHPVNKVNVINGGVQFSNNDSVAFISALAVTTGSPFANGELVTQATTNAHGIIIEVNATAIANTLVLKIKPQTSDLIAANVSGWSFAAGFNVTSNTSNTVSNVSSVIGQFATGTLITDSLGIVQQVVMGNTGVDYIVPPYASIIPTANSTGLTTLNLSPQTYIAQVTVSSVTNSAGLAYAFGVSEGTIYQKGYFVKVSPQTIVVSPYSTAPDNLVVGFDTSESIITAQIDPSLFDNATGTTNQFAPGADRLKLTPSLVVLTSDQATANIEFFPLTAFSLGQPYLQNQETVYSVIGNEMSQRTYETSGNFVLDPFILSTKTAQYSNASQNYFRVNIDPGQAYISGFRVKTFNNYSLQIRKGNDVQSSNGTTVSINYGSYIDSQELGGFIDPTVGTSIELHSVAKQFLTAGATGYQTANMIPANYALTVGTFTNGSNTVTGLISEVGVSTGNYLSPVVTSGIPVGTSVTAIINSTAVSISTNFIGTTGQQNVAFCNTIIGVARIRERKQISGIQGTPNAVARTWLYDVKVANGFNFRSTQSIHTFNVTSALHGIADVILTLDASTNANVAKIANVDYSAIVFPLATNNIKVAQNYSYTYRNSQAIVANQTSSSNNLTVAGLAANEYHPYTNGASLSANQMIDIIMIPQANMVFSTNLAGGSVASTFSNTTLSGIPSTASVYPGDYLRVTQAAATDLRRVTAVVNSTAVTLDSNTTSTSAANVTQLFPIGVPIPVANRANRTISQDPSGKFLTVTLGNTTTSATISIIHNVFVNNTNVIATKTAQRNTVVTLNLGTHPLGVAGPWNLGVPDAFRLRKVYLGAAATVNVNSVDVTSQFYVDNGQTVDALSHSQLYLRPKSTLSLANTNGLLVQFDNYTQSVSGMSTISSYSIDANADALSLATLTAGSNVSVMEISEVPLRGGNTPWKAKWLPAGYLDLIGAVDWRPRVLPTANITSNTAQMTTNPVTTNATSMFGFTNTVQKWPAQGTIFTADISTYMGRVDRIVIDDTGHIKSIEGVPGIGQSTLVAPPEPADSMTINLLYVPPYPTVPDQKASSYLSVLDKNIASQNFTFQRETDHAVALAVVPDSDITYNQPSRYSMQDIAHLDRRIGALEQFVSLTQLEESIKSLQIPSSINAAINRFKFGFFADDFTTDNFTDLNNPEYSARIVNNEVTPYQTTKNLEFIFDPTDEGTTNYSMGKAIVLPFTEVQLLNQSNATDGNVLISNSTVTNTVITPVQSIVCAFVSNQSNNIANTNMSYTYKASVTANAVSFVYGANDVDNDRIWQVWQSNSTSTPHQTLLYNAFGGGSLSGPQITDFQNGASIANNIVPAASLKIINFTHNPVNGLYYTILTSDEAYIGYNAATSESAGFVFRFCYPIDSTQLVPGTANTGNNIILTPGSANSVVNTQPTIYVGQLVSTPASISIDSLFFSPYTISPLQPAVLPPNAYSVSSGSYVSAANKLSLVATGLKPATAHTFTFDSLDSTLYCMSNGAYVNAATLSTVNSIFTTNPAAGYTQSWNASNFSNNMVSDSQGKIFFDFYYGPDLYLESNIVSGTVTTTATTYSSMTSALNRLAGNKIMSIQSVDTTSYANASVVLIAGALAANSATSNTVVVGVIGGGCVALESYLPDANNVMYNDKEIRQAWQTVVGHKIMLAHSTTLEASVGTVLEAINELQPCYRIVTSSGASLVCSDNAPIPTLNNGIGHPPELLGEHIAVLRNGKETWEDVTEVDYVGNKFVRAIDTGNNCFWAGETQDAYILHHNVQISGSRISKV